MKRAIGLALGLAVGIAAVGAFADDLSILNQINQGVSDAQIAHRQDRADTIRGWCGDDFECLNGDGSLPEDPGSTAPAQTQTPAQAAAAGCSQIGCGGLRSVKDNGKINGYPSWTVTCTASGWGVVTRRNDRWAGSLGYTYAASYWSLPLRDFAMSMCGG